MLATAKSSLVIQKEERSILDDGTAQRRAKLVALKARLVRQSVLIEIKIRTRIKNIVPQVFIDATVQMVRSGLGRETDDRRAGSAVFGVVVMSQHLEFLDRFHAGHVASRSRSRRGLTPIRK